ncbi:RNA polymerase II largest subunit [Flagelloscypha sp. PMI_526]|nr:RNA polymerase II largest subunit [Flagelloscypha sp. PMI_526]
MCLSSIWQDMRVLAAQSFEEPVTQMTLNTFHYAGVSSKNVTLSLTRACVSRALSLRLSKSGTTLGANYCRRQLVLEICRPWYGIPPIPFPVPGMTTRETFERTVEFHLVVWVPRQVISPQANNPSWASSKTPSAVFENSRSVTTSWTGTKSKTFFSGSQTGMGSRKGPEATKQLFTGLQTVVNNWLFHDGFGIGIGDTIADEEAMKHIEDIIQGKKREVAALIEKATAGDFLPLPGMTIRETFERTVEGHLNKARDTSGHYAQKVLKEDNNVKQMVVAGSKGSYINISQMSVCVGQQSIEGKRIPFGFKHRTLPHFEKDDFSPESRGFVENSYLRGLTPQEFFFHAMAGREGLIDTAVKTVETEYIQRRLVKALEDVMVCYDGTVRNSLGDLVQFVYGEDGMDGAFIEKQRYEIYAISDREFEHRYCVDVTDPAGGSMPGQLQVGVDDSSIELQEKLDEEWGRLCEDRKTLRTLVFKDWDPLKERHFPVNLDCIIQNARQIFHIDNREPSDLSPAYIIDAVQELEKRLIVVRGDDIIALESQANATLAFKIHLRSTLATRPAIAGRRLTREAFD